MFDMHKVSCWDPNCAAHCCLTDRQYRDAKERGTTFYCTAGHANVYTPSENTNLKKKIAKLEDDLSHAKQRIDWWFGEVQRERKKWKCPFGHCGLETNSKGALVGHIKAKHMAPLMLPAMAGPDALNTQVN